MAFRAYILLLVIFIGLGPLKLHAQSGQKVSFDFYGTAIEFPNAGFSKVSFGDSLSHTGISSFYEQLSATDYEPMIRAILAYKESHKPDDWIYYQLIRKTAEVVSPKADNYHRYTLCKWFLLCKSGYDATLNIVGNQLLFYVQSDEDIYDVPFFTRDGKKYICLNYHDYGFNVDFKKDRQLNIAISVPGADKRFSYKLTQLPNFRPEDYYEKELTFAYNDVNYSFKVKINDELKKMFVNYPVADYKLYFNVPLSTETYNSLVPQLKKNLKGMSVKNGVDYLMRFTRYAFAYQPDHEHFGREKNLSPEQTLLYDRSDCEDRTALFYYLVKEIYNMPMIVMAFPNHLTIAVKFDKPVGKAVMYNGDIYSVCEPTPQLEDLPMGTLSDDLKAVAYEVAYAYYPSGK